MKSVWVQCFNGGLTRHPIFWERIHFEKSESTNLHKHQKKNKVEVEETSTGTKKNKETFQQLWAHFWVGAGNSVFFLCLCRFGASSGLVFFVFFGACQCFVKSESPNLQRHQKKQNKQSGSGGNIDRHQKQKTKFLATMGPLLDRCWEMWICFFLCLCRFGASSGLVFF